MTYTRPHEDRLGTGGAVGEVLTHTGTGEASWTAAGAPTAADYLVGTAQAGLSGEIVVGTTPGGELGGTWASPTVDATHSGSTHTASMVPYLIASGETYTVPLNKQALFEMVIDNQGTLVVDGYLIMVT